MLTSLDGDPYNLIIQITGSVGNHMHRIMALTCRSLNSAMTAQWALSHVDLLTNCGQPRRYC